MGEVMVVKDRSINRVIDLMRKDGLDEKRAIKKIINLGIQDEMGSCKPGQSPSLASLQALSLLQNQYVLWSLLMAAFVASMLLLLW